MRSAQSLSGTTLQHVLAIAFIAAAGIYMLRWSLYPEMTFYMDDWSWLARAEFTAWPSYLSIGTFLPSALFADRPVEELSIKLMYQFFRLNHTGYAVVILFIHLLNGVLLYWLALRLHCSRFYAMVAGILFVINYNVGYPAWWLATIADSGQFLFSLCALLAFSTRSRYAWLPILLFYYLAYRSKEAALPLPLLLVMYAFIEDVRSARASDIAKSLREALRRTWPHLIAFAVLFGYMLHYLIAARQTGMSDYGPYVPRFDLPTVWTGTQIYLQTVAFDQFSPNEAIVGFLVLCAIAVFTWNRTAIIGAIGFFAAIGPVLFLPAHHNPYYAYGAAGFLALMLVALMQWADEWLARHVGVVSSWITEAIVLAGVIWLAHYVYVIGLYREPLLANMREMSKALKNLPTVLPNVEEQSKIVITGLPEGINLFTHAPCTVIRVVFKVWDIDCRIEKPDAELLAIYRDLPGPKMLLQYNEGEIAVRDRAP